MEIEKKYHLAGLPVGMNDGVEIRQGYLTTGDPEVRLRAKGNRFFATRKGGEGFVRSEEEVEISKEIFDILWPATDGKRIEKVRYDVPGSDGLTWEVDQYFGHLTGLFTAEVELPTESTEAVLPPAIASVILADVTVDKRYKNKRLATDGLPA